MNLLPEELEIENGAEILKPVADEKKKKIEGIINTAKKNKAVSLRLANYDLEKIKEKASKQGIPYQTFISSILHKYITNQLLEKDEMIKTVSIMKEMNI